MGTDRRRQWLWLGVGGACVMFVSLALLRTFAAAPAEGVGRPVEEAAHLRYAAAVADGRLPTLGAGNPVANRPPLFYGVAAAALHVSGSDDARPDSDGVLAVRVANVGIGVLALVAVSFLVRELVPSRPDLAVAAVAVTAVMPLFTAVTGLVDEGGLTVATCALALATTVRLVRLGPSWPRLVAVSGALLAAASTSVCGALLVMPVVLAAAAAVAGRAGGRRWRRARLGGGAALVPLAVVTAGAGWFYLCNIRRYGDPTGWGRENEVAGRARVALGDVFSGWPSWRELYPAGWGPLSVVSGVPRLLAWSLLAAIGLGLVLAAWRTVMVRRSSPRERAGVVGPTDTWHDTDWATGLVVVDQVTEPSVGADLVPPRWTVPLVAALLLGFGVAVAVSFVGYVAAGGAFHPRYLVAGMLASAVALAVGLAGLPGARRGVPQSAAVAVVAANAFVLLGRGLTARDPEQAGANAVDRMRSALELHSPVAADLVLPLLLGGAAAGFVLLAGSMWPLCRASVPVWPMLARTDDRRRPRFRRHSKAEPVDDSGALKT